MGVIGSCVEVQCIISISCDSYLSLLREVTFTRFKYQIEHSPISIWRLEVWSICILYTKDHHRDIKGHCNSSCVHFSYSIFPKCSQWSNYIHSNSEACLQNLYIIALSVNLCAQNQMLCQNSITQQTIHRVATAERIKEIALIFHERISMNFSSKRKVVLMSCKLFMIITIHSGPFLCGLEWRALGHNIQIKEAKNNMK